MQKQTKRNFKIFTIAALALVGVLLNHSSYDIAWYSPESVQQQEALEGGRLNVFGPFSYRIDFDGSVVSPVSSANDVRTGIIDGILFVLAGLHIREKYKKNA